MVDLSNLKRPTGANVNRKRLGRGPGSGTGKTSGKGHKGQKARSGFKHRAWFEGGQMPLQRRLPKRGFTPPSSRTWQIINVKALDALDEDTITPELLHEKRMVDLGRKDGIKILGEGELSRAVTVKAHAFSASAREKIEKAGGTAELLES